MEQVAASEWRVARAAASTAALSASQCGDMPATAADSVKMSSSMSANDGLLRQNKYFSNGFEQCSRNNLQNREKFNFGLTFSMNEMVVVRKRLSWMIQIHKLMNVDHNIIIMLIDKFILYYIHTGCPTIEFSLCFACLLGFQCSYRRSFYHFSIAQET